MLVQVENGRATKLQGDPCHPVTRGFLCGKVARYLEREYSPERLLYPQKRVGPKGAAAFQRINWEDALDTIAARLQAVAREFGPEAILPYSYAGTMGLLNGSGMDRRFFHRLGASRLDRTICSSTGGAALMATLGLRYGTEPEQFRDSKLILAWAANIHGTNVHLWPFIVEARRKGARLFTIDPVRTRTAALSDRHFSIFPGRDLALALGLAHVIIGEGLHDEDYVAKYTNGFEDLKQLAATYPPERVEAVTGIAREDVAQLAREYAGAKPAVIRVNYGVQRSERGGAAVRAIAALPALTGSFREAGGGLQLSTAQAFRFNKEAVEMPELQRQSPLGRQARIVNMAELGKALDGSSEDAARQGDGGVQLQSGGDRTESESGAQGAAPRGFIHRGAGAISNRHGGLRGHPAAGDDIFGAYRSVFGVRALSRADGEAGGGGSGRGEVERGGFPGAGEADGIRGSVLRRFRRTDDRCAAGLGPSVFKGITRERLEREHSVRFNVSPEGEPFVPFAAGGFGTASGKCEFGAEGLEYRAPVESRLGDQGLRKKYPLEFVSSKNDDSMNSTFGFRTATDEQTSVLYLHPLDAAARGIANGDSVRVFNDRGSLLLKAAVQAAAASPVQPGVTRAPSTRWGKKAVDGRNANALTADRLSDMGGGPTFYNCLVEVERCGD